jgi:hypothetical protein
MNLVDSHWASSTHEHGFVPGGAMSVLRQNLPLQIMPTDNNPEGLKFQGILEELANTEIHVRMGDDFANAPDSEALRVYFILANYSFRFDTRRTAPIRGNLLTIAKPTQLYRSVIRKARRLSLHANITFNIWTEPGLHNAVLTDLSSVGMKMTTTRLLPKGTLISVNVYLPGKSIRFICQAIVRWCTRLLTVEPQYICGVQFTTLSDEATKRIEKFIQEELSKQRGISHS